MPRLSTIKPAEDPQRRGRRGRKRGGRGGRRGGPSGWGKLFGWLRRWGFSLAMLVLQLVVVVVMLLLGQALVEPEDLSDIQGREGAESRSVRSLSSRLRTTIQRGTAPLRLSEAELNDFLVQTLDLEQGGLLADEVELVGVWLRLKPGYVELVFERLVGEGERRHTVALLLDVEDAGEGEGWQRIQVSGMQDWSAGARFGSLEVPAGLAVLVLDGFEELRRVLEPELELVLEMQGIEVSEDEVVLTPYPPRD